MATCKACGEDIVWVTTPAGKAMPVDAESYGQHTLTEGVTIVTDSGAVMRGTPGGTERVYGYTPHWQCPFADQFRRRA